VKKKEKKCKILDLVVWPTLSACHVSKSLTVIQTPGAPRHLIVPLLFFSIPDIVSPHISALLAFLAPE
jgi:hypothetical protein